MIAHHGLHEEVGALTVPRVLVAPTGKGRTIFKAPLTSPVGIWLMRPPKATTYKDADTFYTMDKIRPSYRKEKNQELVFNI